LKRIRILAISGSLRAASSNTAVLRALIALAPENVEITLFGGLGDLPHFNPDLDGDIVPPPVEDLRARLRASDGLLISCPEYAHGVPGVMKNALDWLVSTVNGEIVGKPVALINVSSRSTWAQESLTETLTVMSARFLSEACVTLPLTRTKIDEAGLIADPEISAALRSALAVFVGAIEGSHES
jgi:chromate reductase, NAD(P)H dehydrogenase (quinone)